jgi:hypothetical protein
MTDTTPTYTCRCGHRAHWHLFHVDGFGNDLPHNHHRCPACGWQWSRIKNPDRIDRITRRIVLANVAQPVL